ncbi:Nucleoside diphosphate kinase, mitochondrial [Merluccius polli]|uniref:Nucleoside diphosphate kinase n=1 Tax=Merluccius polli TaxID=89951 RepID=A0AA47N553_MERPO|nr:Nucleoside diphosphate kinase, mitochondrial [Merluccius polli]
MSLWQRCVSSGILQHGRCLRRRVWDQALVSKFTSSPPRRTQSSVAGGAERTLIAVKPDGVQRRHVGQIIQRFEQRGFKLVGLKMLQASDGLLSQHYCQLVQKPFYPNLLHYMTSGPVVAMVWEGQNVVQSSRRMVGPTNPVEAQPGTVRGDFSLHTSRNVVHASDSVEGAQREIQLWFEGKELLNWDCFDHSLTYKEDE